MWMVVLWLHWLPLLPLVLMRCWESGWVSWLEVGREVVVVEVEVVSRGVRCTVTRPLWLLLAGCRRLLGQCP